MRTPQTIICTICATLILAGCSTTDDAVEIYNDDNVRIDLTQEHMGDYDHQAVEPENHPLVYSSSNGSVEIFDLDEGGVLPSYNGRRLPTAYGTNFVEPNVQIFPVDGASADNSNNVTRIYFGHGSTELGGHDMDIIKQISRNFVSGMGETISVEGYASSRAGIRNVLQSRSANLKTSMKRAMSVTRALMESGVPPEAIRTVAWGDTRPDYLYVDGKDPEAAARRVEIIIK